MESNIFDFGFLLCLMIAGGVWSDPSHAVLDAFDGQQKGKMYHDYTTLNYVKVKKESQTSQSPEKGDKAFLIY